MVKLHKPQRMGNRKSVIAYQEATEVDVPEIEVDDDADNADNADDASGRDTLFVTKNNGCMRCHRDAHQPHRSSTQFRATATGRTGPVISVLTDGNQVSVQTGFEVFGIGVLGSLTFDRRAGTSAMPTIIVAEPDNTRVGGD